MIVQGREFANYLRENSGVKDHATSSEIHDACSVKLKQCEGDQTPHGEGTSSASC
jgi:hypothetical protein